VLQASSRKRKNPAVDRVAAVFLMEIIDNITRLLGDDLKRTVTPGAKLQIAASCFSIYAYEALKAELEQVESVEFIFTSPTFLQGQATDKLPKEKRSNASAASTAPSSKSSSATNSPSAPSPANAPSGSGARSPSAQTPPNL
jgi:hypothetical protein